MAARTRPPFRADHVGSLLRPKALLDARERFKQGSLDAAGLRAVEDTAIRDAIRMQEEIGLQGVTDGEMRRGSWHMDFLYQFGGVERVQDNLKVQFRNRDGVIEFTPAALKVVDRVRLKKTIFAEDFQFVQRTTKHTPKLTVPAPSMMHYRGGRAAVDQAVYPDLIRFWDDLGTAYAEEVEALGRLGCTYLQLDDTSLAYVNDPKQRDYITKQGGDGAQQHLTYIKVINDALKKKPATMSVTTHLCRGNFRSSWVAEGGYDFVAEALFNELKVDGFFLEYDDERSGGFEPLRFVPKGKMVVLGIVTTKQAVLEKKDDLKRRIDQAAKFVPLDQICLSPQCGFSSTVDGNAIGYDQQVAKLRLVAETAREIWG